jgi:exosortase
MPPDTSSSSPVLRSACFVLAALAALWFVLINQLRLEWDVDPQYAYGWAVPFLCLWLLWEKVRGQGAASAPQDDQPAVQPSLVPALAFALLALLFLPIRLLQEAAPQWRLTNWLLASDVIGLTLLALRFAWGSGRVAPLAFPILFFLVAVPWPTSLEFPLITRLTRLNITCTIELLNACGVPALQHGNVIEIAAGVVGIDQGCSGIRSFQATLMISLFLGEMYRLALGRRLWLCLGGFSMAFLFNVGRTFLLVWVASRQGIPAIAQWHDPAGVAILVACFLGLWILGLRLKPEASTQAGPPAGSQPARFPSLLRRTVFASPLWAAFGIWVFLALGAVEAWYRVHELNLPVNPAWTVVRPSAHPTFKELPMAEDARQALRFDQAINAAWQESDASRWQMIFLRWRPGRVAAHLAQGHAPEGCLTATGRKLLSASELRVFPVQGLPLPFRVYRFQENSQVMHVFYCLWQDRAARQFFQRQDILGWRSRLANVWLGRRNLGQRSLELAVWGIPDAAQAEQAFRQQLEKLVQLEP